MNYWLKGVSFVGCLLLVFASTPKRAQAVHSWGNYHWARSANPFVLRVGDNVTAVWDNSLQTAVTDWTQSTVLDLLAVTGMTSPRRCRPVSGRVEVCNYKYGNNGWLGLAQIWVSGDHISQGVVKVNDTYFNTTTYNKPAWRQLVMCQEIGHTLGLDHQDENFNNAPLGTCMDYTSDPTPNQHPNTHDYEQLEAIYAHLDTFTSVKQLLSGLPSAATLQNMDLEELKELGRQIRQQGRAALFEKDLGRGVKVFTFIIWANGEN